MSFGNKTCTARSLKSFKGESVFILLFSKLQLKQVLEYKFKHMLLLWEIHSHACCIKNYYNCKVRYTLDNEKNQFCCMHDLVLIYNIKHTYRKTRPRPLFILTVISVSIIVVNVCIWKKIWRGLSRWHVIRKCSGLKNMYRIHAQTIKQQYNIACEQIQ